MIRPTLSSFISTSRFVTRGLVRPHAQGTKGNVFALLFAAVALTGVLAAVGMQTLTGPVTTITRVTQKNIADTQILMNARIVINASTDSDGDGTVEPKPWPTPIGAGETPPTNGGFLPMDLGLSLTDPWGTKYGYCVWDHGTTNMSTGRINGDTGTNAPQQPVLAIIAAGPDKTFQTTCPAISGGSIIAVSRQGDDVALSFTYSQAQANANGLWTLDVNNAAKAELRNAANTAASVSINRETGIGNFIGITTDTIAAKTDVITVDGGLKLDSDYTTCGAPQAGALRYENVNKVIEVCDGTAWKPSSGSDLWKLENTNDLHTKNLTYKVGIGLTAPTEMLDVAGNQKLSGNISVGGTGSVAGNFIVNTNALSVNAASKFVGVGVAVPTVALDVLGNQLITGNSVITGDLKVDTTTLVVDSAANKVGINTAPVHILDVVSPGNIGTLGAYNFANAGLTLKDDAGYMYFDGHSIIADKAMTMGTTGTVGMQFITNQLQRMSIDAAGTVAVANNETVGGTLGVAGATTLSSTLSVTGNTAIDANTLYVDAALNSVGIGTVNPKAVLEVAGAIKVGSQTTCSADASNNGTVRYDTVSKKFQLCVDGIWGSISSIDKLDDIGDVSITEIGAPNDHDVLSWDSTTSKWVAKGIAALGNASVLPAGATGDVQYKDGSQLGADSAYHWDITNKRLGIGTNLPQTDLHVKRNSGSATIRLESGTNNTDIFQTGTTASIMNNATGGSMTLSTVNEISLWTGTTAAKRISIGGTGLVGISTSAPKAQLDVAGGIRLADDTNTCTSDNVGTMRFNNSQLQICVANNWTSVSATGGLGATMFPNWPDAINCGSTANPTVYYLTYAPYTDGYYYYRNILDSADRAVWFNADRTYRSKSTGETGCDSKSITTLYAESRAFNFVGSGTGSADGASIITSVPDALDCGVLGARRILYLQSSSTTDYTFAMAGGSSSMGMDVVFNLLPAGTWVATNNTAGWDNASGCDSKTLTQLTAEHRAYNLAGASSGGGGGGGSGITVAGANGYIQFNTSNGLDAESSLFWDKTNDRLGVGTNIPQAAIDVAGGVRFGTDTCTPPKAGMVVYNAGALKLCKTDGTWDTIVVGAVSVASGGAGAIQLSNGTGGLSSAAGFSFATGTLSVTGNETLSGTLNVTGATTLGALSAGATTLTSLGVTNNTTIGGLLTVTGDTSLGGDLLVDAGTLKVDSASNRVSIGGSGSAVTALDVAGAIHLGNDTAACSGQMVGAVRFNNDTLEVCTATNGWIGAGSGGAGLWTVSGNDAYSTNTGNIGIGITTPAAKLDVAGGVRLGQDSATCIAAKAGTLRYTSSKLQICSRDTDNAYRWLDVTMTSTLAAPTGDAAQPFVATWPDALKCTASGVTRIFYAKYSNVAQNMKYYYARESGYYVRYNNSGSFSNTDLGTTADCYGKSISEWSTAGMTFNFKTGTATTMLAGWPDSIRCSYSNTDRVHFLSVVDGSKVRYADPTANYLDFNPGTRAASGQSYPNGCSGKSIDTIAGEGRTYNMVGGDGTKSMATNYPDAIVCNATNGDQYVLHRWQPYTDSTGYVDYRDMVGTDYYQFRTDNRFYYTDNFNSDCRNKSLDALIAAGRTYNYVDNGEAATTTTSTATVAPGTPLTPGWPDLLVCNGPNGSNYLLRYSWKAAGPTGYRRYITSSNSDYIQFNSDKSFNAASSGVQTTDCNNASLPSLENGGRSRNWKSGGQSQPVMTGWPDAIRCNYDTGNSDLIFHYSYRTASTVVYGYWWGGQHITFNTNGTYNSAYYTTDCNNKSIAQLSAEPNRVFNWYGGTDSGSMEPRVPDMIMCQNSNGDVIPWHLAQYPISNTGLYYENMWGGYFYFDYNNGSYTWNTNSGISMNADCQNKSLAQLNIEGKTVLLNDTNNADNIPGRYTPTGASMVDGWPDAIVCRESSNRPWIFYYSYQDSTYTYYTTTYTGSTTDGDGTGYGPYNYYYQFNNNREYYNDSMNSDCRGKSITQLSTYGQTFNLLGGGGSSGSDNAAAGNPGNIQFRAGTSLAGDDNLFWNNTSKRLGIGTTNPLVKVQIAGGVKLGLETAACSSATAGTIQWTGTALQVCDGGGWSPIAGGGGGATGAAGVIQLSDGSGAFTADPTSFKWDMTNDRLGLGTVAPVAELQINQSTAPRILLSNATTGVLTTDGLQISMNANNAIINNAESGTLSLATNNATRVTVLATGEVGIGTVSPAAALDVNGGIKLGTTTNCAVGGANNGTMRFDAGNTNTVQVCLNGGWTSMGAGGGGGSGTTMEAGWPDVIYCHQSGNQYATMYRAWSYSDGQHIYATPWGASYGIYFWGNGAYNTQTNMGSSNDCVAQQLSIQQLNAMGRTFTWNGGGANNGGGLGTNASMTNGWPDALRCNVTSPNWGPTTFQFVLGPYSVDGLYYYRAINSNGTTNYNIKFASAGTFSGYDNITTSDCNASINSLYSTGKAFNLAASAAMAGGANTQVQWNNNGVTMGNANFVWDNVNARLGIGTASPTSNLSVIGSGLPLAGAGYATITTGVAAGQGMLLGYDTGQNTGILGASSSAANGMAFWTYNGSWGERMRMLNNGSLGIGTTTPLAKLDVLGGIRVGEDLTCGVAKAGMLVWNSNELKLCTSAGTFITVASVAGVNPSATGATGQIQFNNSGAMGADSNFYWDNVNKRLQLGSNGNPPTAKFQIDYPMLTAYTNVAPLSQDSLIHIGNFTPTEFTNAQAQIQFTVNGGTYNRVGSIGMIAESAGNRNSALVFTTDDSGSRNEKMRITGAGQVGIGTTTPLFQLEVASNQGSLTNPAIAIRYTGSPTAGNKGLLLFTHNRIIDNTEELLGYVQGIAENNQSQGGMRFVTRAGGGSDVETMRMTSQGYVGIGTSTPQATLDVNGGIRLGTTSTCAAGNAGTLRWTGAAVEVCNGGSWIGMGSGGGGSGTGTTMAAGFPDAIMCNYSGWGPTVWELGQAPAPDGYYYYYPTWNGSYYIRFTTAGVFQNATLTNDCGTMSIAQLYSAGKAFNYVGGGGTNGGASGTNASMVSGVPDAIVCTGSTANVSVVLHQTDINAAGNVEYVSAYTHSQASDNLRMSWNKATGAYVGVTNVNNGYANWTGYYENCVGKTLSTLYSEGKAFNLAAAAALASGTSGSVQFSGGANLLSDNANFFWDNTNKRLGLFTNAPLAPMHIYAAATSDSGFTTYGPSSAVNTNGFNVGYGGGTFGAGAGFLNAHSAAGNTGTIYFSTDSAARMMMNGSGLSIGYGTTAPVARLDVNGGIRSGADTTCNVSKAGMLAWNSNTLQLCTNTGTFVNVANAAGIVAGAAGTSGQLQFNNAGAIAADTALYWDNTNKRLGIGVNTPGAPLHVFSNGQVLGGTGYYNTVSTSTSGVGSFFGYDNTQSTGIVGPTSATTGGLAFWTHNGSAWGERMRLSITGQLGLGTIAPAVIGDGGAPRLLHIAGSGVGNIGLLQLTTDQTSAQSVGAVTFGSTGLTSTDKRLAEIVGGKADATTSSATGYMQFYTANAGTFSEKMRIDNLGQVGIGTTSPQALLDVNGGIRIGNTTTCVAGNAGTLRYTGSAVEVCNGGSWVGMATGGGGSGSGTSMTAGWPDAIVCNMTSPNWGRVTLIPYQTPDPAGNYYYVTTISTSYYGRWNSNGTFGTWTNVGTADCNQSISTLYSTGKAFNFVGGGGSNGGSSGTNASMQSGLPDAIVCTGSTSGTSATLYQSGASAANVDYVSGSTVSSATDNLRLSWNKSTGAYVGAINTGGWTGMYENCTTKTIAQLYTAGMAYNLASSTALASGTSGLIQFSGGANLQSDNGLSWDNTNKSLVVNSTGALVSGTVRYNLTTANAGAVQTYVGADTATNASVIGTGSGTAGGLAFWTYNGGHAERMRLTVAGNLGLGTASPQAKLDVAGGVKPGAETCSVAKAGMLAWNSNVLQLCTSAGTFTNLASAAGLTSAAGSDKNVQFNVNGTMTGDNNLTWDNSNKFLGIGESGPVARLNVYSGSNATQTNFTQALGLSGIVIGTNYSASSYTPGIFWRTNDDNNTKPKAGIYLYQDGSGTRMYFGTSNSYAAGITSTGMVIDPSGNIGMGTSSPSQKLEVAGTVKATSFLNTSDQRLKKDISTLKGLEIIRKLRGVSFVWKDSGKEAMGLIAQEVEKVVPFAVVTDAQGMKSVDYIMMIGPMIEAIKELDSKVTTLEGENAKLKARVDSLETTVKTLEDRLKAIEAKIGH